MKTAVVMSQCGGLCEVFSNYDAAEAFANSKENAKYKGIEIKERLLRERGNLSYLYEFEENEIRSSMGHLEEALWGLGETTRATLIEDEESGERFIQVDLKETKTFSLGKRFRAILDANCPLPVRWSRQEEDIAQWYAYKINTRIYLKPKLEEVMWMWYASTEMYLLKVRQHPEDPEKIEILINDSNEDTLHDARVLAIRFLKERIRALLREDSKNNGMESMPPPQLVVTLKNENLSKSELATLGWVNKKILDLDKCPIELEQAFPIEQ